MTNDHNTIVPDFPQGFIVSTNSDFTQGLMSRGLI